MSTSTHQNVIDWNEKEGKLPSMLNVLTILTFIGCGFGLIFAFWGYAGAQNYYDKMQATSDQLDKMPSMVRSMMGSNPMEMARRSLENKLPMLILGLVGIGLCILGAIQMRQFKKQGFAIYVIGEILPIVTLGIFIGFGIYPVGSLAFSIILVLAFILMYATQLKYLK